MPYDAYPTLDDLSDLLDDSGLALPSTAGKKLAAMIARFEELTGYRPFLGASAETEVPFDAPPPSMVLDLKGGFWEVSEVRVGVTYASTGTLLVPNRDYVLRPYEADGDNTGYTEIEFLCGVPDVPRSVRVKGKRGYARQIPDDAHLAILRGALAECVMTAQGGEGAIRREKQGPVEYEYDTTAGRDSVTRARDYFQEIALSYQRVTL